MDRVAVQVKRAQRELLKEITAHLDRKLPLIVRRELGQRSGGGGFSPTVPVRAPSPSLPSFCSPLSLVYVDFIRVPGGFVPVLQVKRGSATSTLAKGLFRVMLTFFYPSEFSYAVFRHPVEAILARAGSSVRTQEVKDPGAATAYKAIQGQIRQALADQVADLRGVCFLLLTVSLPVVSKRCHCHRLSPLP